MTREEEFLTVALKRKMKESITASLFVVGACPRDIANLARSSTSLEEKPPELEYQREKSA